MSTYILLSPHGQVGNLTSVIDANNHKAVHTYDELNRLTRTDYYSDSGDTEAVKSITYSYNDMGILTGYNDGTSSATYDDLQRKLSENVNYGLFGLENEYTYHKNSMIKLIGQAVLVYLVWGLTHIMR